MNLNDAEQFRIKKLAEGAPTDGCTWAPEIAHKCCQMHDFLKRFRPDGISTSDADRLLRECMQKRGYPITAWVYWIGVRIGVALRLYR